MRIAWEASALLPPRTGVGRCAFELLRALLALRGGDDEFHMLWRSLRRELTSAERDALRGAEFHTGRFPPGPMLMALWSRGWGPRIETLIGEGVDLVHGTAALLPPSRARTRVLTIHDLHFMRHPKQTSPLGGKMLARHLPRVAHAATRVITPSEATACDCVERLSIERERIAVIPHGGAEVFGQEPCEADWARFKALRSRATAPRFWLVVGNDEPRKNLGVIFEAHFRGRHSQADIVPLLVGSDHVPRSVFKESLRRRRIDWTQFVAGRLDDDLLRCAYRRAEALIMPSLAEGFGLPLLEAMASGCPVICSDIPVFHEVTGGHARFFNPRDAESLVDQMAQALADPDGQRAIAARARDHAAPFTWERAANRTWEVYLAACGTEC